jgi:hypothetical protein
VAPQVDVVADAAALAMQSKIAESQPMPTAPGPVADAPKPVEPFVPPAKADKPKRERKPRAPAKPRARTKH